MSTSQVEKLVEYRKDDRRYRVRWSGYASEDDSWVVPRDIDEPADLFKKFWTEKIQNEGRSTLLELPFEQFLVQRVRVQLAGNLSPSTSEILLTIKNEANNFRHLPGWPTYLSTSEDCAKFIMQHPGYEDILTIVHQQEAYAWFCEYFTLPIG
ncbi:hypothetical protein FRC16_002769 [Serendipita sp. 398]|nr:hypothetical protein FRC16_002769 [Serendipita sp. 398]